MHYSSPTTRECCPFPFSSFPSPPHLYLCFSCLPRALCAFRLRYYRQCALRGVAALAQSLRTCGFDEEEEGDDGNARGEPKRLRQQTHRGRQRQRRVRFVAHVDHFVDDHTLKVQSTSHARAHKPSQLEVLLLCQLARFCMFLAHECSLRFTVNFFVLSLRSLPVFSFTPSLSFAARAPHASLPAGAVRGSWGASHRSALHDKPEGVQ